MNMKHFKIISVIILIGLWIYSPVYGKRLDESRDIEFKSDYDQSPQRYILRLPEDFNESVSHDLLIALHGHGSDRWQFAEAEHPQCTAVRDTAGERDMIFVSPDYRAKTSWMGPAAEADVVHIIEELKARYKIGKVFVCGGSMGGSSALTFAVLHPDKIAGVAAMNPTANHLEYEGFQDAIAHSFGGTKEDIPDEYKKRSAEYWPERFTFPVAISVGGKDTIVPPDSAMRLAGVLQRLGKQVTLINRPEAGHDTTYEDVRQMLEFILNPPALISDIPGTILLSMQDWGELGIDECTHLPGQKGLPLQIHNKVYKKGLGSHANGTVVIDLGGAYSTFESEVGVQWQMGGPGNVTFKVLADEKEVFNSGRMTETTPAQSVHVSVAGVQELMLITATEGSITNCAGNWAQARLTRSNNPIPPAARETVDIGQFGRVVTWDPGRMDGCRNNRFQDFTVEYLYLENDVPANANGLYTVPKSNGIGCIGLQWLEQRRIKSVGIQFADASGMPPRESVQVQYWVMTRQGGSPGGSVWQGRWENFDGTLRQEQDRWIYTIDWKDRTARQRGTLKIRWIFPAAAQDIAVRRLTALPDSKWETVGLSLLFENAGDGGTGSVKLYNGEIVDEAGNASVKTDWDVREPLHLKVRYCTTTYWMTDRTVVRLTLPNGTFGVAVDDVLNNGCVYVKEFGLFAAKDPALTLNQYKASIADRKTILERVHTMPDQTFRQAEERVHRAGADLGPTLLSLACDNVKFLVGRDGSVHFRDSVEVYNASAAGSHAYQKYLCQIKPKFGSVTSTQLHRQLQNGWLPIELTTINDNGVVYRQRTFVAPYDFDPVTAGRSLFINRKPLCTAQFTIENTQSKDADVSIAIRIFSDSEKNESAELQPTAGGALATKLGKPLAAVAVIEAGSLQSEIKDGVWTLAGRLSANGRAECSVYIPGWAMAADELTAVRDSNTMAANTEAYWKRVMEPAMTFEIPDPKLQNLIVSSQVHCMLAARNEDYTNVAAWIASSDYGPLESEAQSVIRGMQITGNLDFARNAHDFFIKRYNTEGFITPTYTVMGTGWHLWCLGEYYNLTRDTAWLRANADEIARVCRWLMNACEKTKRVDAFGNRVPEWGLLPPGTMADWEVFNYYYCMNGYYYAGLNAAGQALKDIDYHGAQKMIDNAARLRDNILRAYHWTQSQAPVYPLQDGTWVPAYPTHVYCPGPIDNFYKGEDFGRSWAYDVEIGSHHLIAQGVMDPGSQDAHWIMNHMEDVQFLGSGWGYEGYSSEKNHEDWFNLGGFAKVQPFYARTAEVYGLQDDVKGFLRAYFNATISLLNRENLSLWEHFHNGAYNKTHETGYFLHQSRMMMVTEKGDQLWLAPFVTDRWFDDGMRVAVSKAPTQWGPIAYEITSHVNAGYIEARIVPPTRQMPEEIILRLRHPDGKAIRSVEVDGKKHTNFDPARDIVRLTGPFSPMTVKAMY